ncbi:MAG: hypothetical protein IT260_02240 [Saprospiraceae bacterium]|nr:hypothetical protein [Saprospiraceae bacterium]
MEHQPIDRKKDLASANADVQQAFISSEKAVAAPQGAVQRNMLARSGFHTPPAFNVTASPMMAEPLQTPDLQLKCADCEEEEKVQKKTNGSVIQRVSWEGAASETACALLNDQEIYNLFINIYFLNQPNAKRHLIHYRYGRGAEYSENVGQLFVANPRIRASIARQIDDQIQGGATTQGVIIGRGVDDGQVPPIRQSDYDSEDWRNANGNIDEVRWQLEGTYNPRGYNRFQITIRDPYTWHAQEGRPTQCIHAAMERLKRHGAADYLTTGTGSVLLPPVQQAPDLPVESEW